LGITPRSHRASFAKGPAKNGVIILYHLFNYFYTKILIKNICMGNAGLGRFSVWRSTEIAFSGQQPAISLQKQKAAEKSVCR
jgi:hypothetical protein